MTARPVKVSCNMCGYGSVPCRHSLFESNGKKMEKLKWICPRCGRVTKQLTQEAK